jgi:hypothetical protein
MAAKHKASECGAYRMTPGNGPETEREASMLAPHLVAQNGRPLITTATGGHVPAHSILPE